MSVWQNLIIHAPGDEGLEYKCPRLDSLPLRLQGKTTSHRAVSQKGFPSTPALGYGGLNRLQAGLVSRGTDAKLRLRLPPARHSWEERRLGVVAQWVTTVGRAELFFKPNRAQKIVSRD